jgi:hypothetical protein
MNNGSSDKFKKYHFSKFLLETFKVFIELIKSYTSKLHRNKTFIAST